METNTPVRQAPGSAGAASSGGPRLQAVQRDPEAMERPAPAQKPVEVASAAAAGPRNLAECAALAAEKRDIPLKVSIERQMRLVNFVPGRIEFQPTPDADKDLAGMLGRKLSDWTGTRWIVAVSRTQGRPTLHEEREATQRQMLLDARAEPVVASLLAAFPGAEVVDVRLNAPESEMPAADPLLAEALGEAQDSDES
jgi:DNA polymerase-3 subunit gamma/tau